MASVPVITKAAQTVYVVFNDGGKPLKPANQLSGAYESYASGNWTGAKYCVAAQESIPGAYAAAVPAWIAGGYYLGYIQAGGSPATTDLCVWEREVFPLRADNAAAALAGTGPFAMRVLVQDADAEAIAGATVAARIGQVADADGDDDGNATLNLAAGAVEVLASAEGYTRDASPQTVQAGGTWQSSGTSLLTITLAALSPSITPGPGQIVGRTTTYDQAGDPAAAVTLKYQLTALAAGVATGTFDGGVKSAVSGGDGLWQAKLIQGATYRFWTQCGKELSQAVPSAGDAFDLDPIIGRYA